MNKKNKTKVESNVKADILQRANQIFDNFRNYTDGVRVLFLIHRNKEGGETNNSKVQKIVTTNSEDFRLELIRLVDQKERSLIQQGLPYRIYSSVNSRNMNKAIRQFKYEQLDADFYGEQEKHNFYLNIKDRWIGCLMQPGQRDSSLFLFDCDNEEGRDVYGEALSVIPNELIIRCYATKNGWHIITHPFNYTEIQLPKNVGLNKDGLLLLDF